MVAIIPASEASKPTPNTPLRYGLFQAAVGPKDFPDIHMRGGGLWYRAAPCGTGQGYEINCLDALDTKVFSDSGLDIVTGVPFVVMANYECMPTGDTPEQALAQAEALTLQTVVIWEQALVEAVFSSGVVAQAPSLANNPAVVTLTPTSTNVIDVISELENAMYCTSQYGQPAYLHMPIFVFNRMKSEHLIEFDGKRWRTPMGSVVSPGCYAGTDPDGAEPDPGVFWIYATGQTTVWRSADAFIAPVEGAWNRTTNEYTGLAEREYVVTFECAIYAAPTTLWTVTP